MGDRMKKLLIYDAADKTPVSRWWAIGARVYAGAFTKVLPVHSEEELVEQLGALAVGRTRARTIVPGF